LYNLFQEHRIMHTILSAATVLLAAALTACTSTTTQPVEANLLETARQAGSFQTLVTAVEQAGLAATLTGTDEFTVFAPTDAAFAALPAGIVDALLSDSELLTAVLTYHVVPGRLGSAAVAGRSSLTTANGQALGVTTVGGGVQVDGVQVVQADIGASNGVIHVIDDVLTPLLDIARTARLAGGFETLLAAVEAAGLGDALTADGALTVFAPTDAAFAALPEGALEALLDDREALTAVLTYHVAGERLPASEVVSRSAIQTLNGASLSVRVEGDAVWVGDARVVATDVETTNGIIHVIDAVLLP
jgi:transforming growth factor-beta-induced protein